MVIKMVTMVRRTRHELIISTKIITIKYQTEVTELKNTVTILKNSIEKTQIADWMKWNKLSVNLETGQLFIQLRGKKKKE